LKVDGTEVRGERRLVLDPTAPGFHYESLGRIIRTNVVRGDRTSTYGRGVTQTDYNESVFDRQRQQETATSHHKQRDDMSTFKVTDLTSTTAS